MQADAGLVQDVQDPHEAGADLGRQPDPLGFSAGQGPGSPGQCQVIQPYVFHEGQPGTDLFQDLTGDLPLLIREPDMVDEIDGLGHGKPGEFIDVDASHRYRQDLRFEPLPAAGTAGDHAHVLFDLGFDVVGARTAVPPFQIVHHSFKSPVEMGPAGAAVTAVKGVGQRGPRPVQQGLLEVLGQFPVRSVQTLPITFGQGGNDLEIVAVLIHGGKDAPQGTVRHGFVRILHHQIRIHA